MATRTTRNLNDAIDNIYEELNEGGGGSPKMYLARFAQSGTSNPVVTEFLNTTGLTITCVRIGAGNYEYSGFTSRPFISGFVYWVGTNATAFPIFNDSGSTIGYYFFYWDSGVNKLYLGICNDLFQSTEFSTLLPGDTLDLPAIYLS
jgi:hypothetical protein